MSMTRSRIRRSLLATLAALALIATACGGSDAAVATQADNDAASSSSSGAADTAEAESPAEPANSLVASTIDGGQIDFGSLEGQDVVLWFWAPW